MTEPGYPQVTHGHHSESVRSAPRDRLVWIVIAPLVWAIHFLACYLTAAIWCAKHRSSEGLGPVGVWIAVYTVIALCGIGHTGWHSFRKHRYGSGVLPHDAGVLPHDAGVLPHDAGTADDRRRFIGFASLLLAILSFVATLFTALAFVFVGSCD